MKSLVRSVDALATIVERILAMPVLGGLSHMITTQERRRASARRLRPRKWRRAATMTAIEMKGLMAARASINAEVFEKHKDAMAEFSGICGSHQDYLWDVVHETP